MSKPHSIAASPRVFIARQPILDRSGRVFGYELLHRDSTVATVQRAVADERATAHVLSDGLLAIGLDVLTGGRQAFINVSRQFLLDGIPRMLPPDSVVFCVGADVEAGADVLEACRMLRADGYRLAIDHFLLATGAVDFVPLADFVRVSFIDAATTADRTRLLSARVPPAASLMATKVESAETFQEAVTEGYHYFQGSFFGRPVVKEGRSVPSQQIAQLRLLHALNDPNRSVHQIADLIKPDPAMCYRVLRAVNSARFALQTTVSSISEALVLLGRDTVKRWVSLWSLATLSGQANAELLAITTVRARCCELLGETLDREDAGAQAFLLGLCSMLDAILERPMSALVSELPLSESIRGALLGEDNGYRRLLDCVIAYERGDWDQAIELAEASGANANVLATAYSDAMRWAYELDRLSERSGSAA